MNHSRRIRQLLKPLLNRHADLAMAGGWLILTPVHHLFRGMILDRTSTPGHLRPQWAMVHLFSLRGHIPLDWGDYLFDQAHPLPNDIWQRSQAEISAILCQRIEESTLPHLRAMTLEDVDLRLQDTDKRLILRPGQNLIVQIALGNFDAARAICSDNLARWSTPKPYWDDGMRKACARMCDLSALLTADDRKAMAALLQEWEATTVKQLKIEEIWRWTPLPFELDGA
jgi:hypothetical protein